MAYSSSLSLNARRSTAIAVTLLEGAAIYAIVMGLSYVIKVPKAPPLISDFTLAPASPVPADHERRKQDPAIKPSGDPLAPPTAGPTPLPTDTSTRDGTDTGTGTGTVIVTPTPNADPMPLFTPKAAKPRGRPGDWVTASDYPSQDLREGNQGTVRFSLSIDANGKVTSCAITAPSGFPGLDSATCAKLKQRARFEPATDGNNARISGTWSNSVRWQIPRD